MVMASALNMTTGSLSPDSATPDSMSRSTSTGTFDSVSSEPIIGKTPTRPRNNRRDSIVYDSYLKEDFDTVDKNTVISSTYDRVPCPEDQALIANYFLPYEKSPKVKKVCTLVPFYNEERYVLWKVYGSKKGNV
eukprot:Awhi_evm1s9717